jgi:MFS family permease
VKEVLALLRAEPRARWFFVALTQSALGTGAAYPALLLIAYERFHSPWAISAVLVADLAPAMFLGPLFGALADRWSRRWCTVAADVLRAGAFIGVALAQDFALTIAFAALAGVGTALFTPAALAGLPSLVSKERIPAATSLYGAIADLGFTAGPGLAAVVLVVAGPEEILLVNGISFAVSALILARLPFGFRPAAAPGTDFKRPPSLLRETREGLAIVARMRGIRIVIAGSTGALFFGGLFNVAELLFATEDLNAGDAAYSVLVALFGFGFVFGSLAGSKGGAPELLRKRFLQGAVLMGLGFLLAGLAPTVVVAFVTFMLAGFGNGLLLVHERVIVQQTLPDGLLGRAFGVKDALASWAFGLAFLAAGGLLTVMEPRTLILGSGIGGLLVALVCVLALRREGSLVGDPQAGRRLGGRGGTLPGLRREEDGADLIRGGDLRPPLLDHPD